MRGLPTASMDQGSIAFRPRISWLLTFVPITLLLELSGAKAPSVFLSAMLAIVPLARLIIHATEQLASRLGPAAGGLLNATFGNFPELIIAFVALSSGLEEMVRASIIGALLANLLLTNGLSSLAGGVKYHVQEYSTSAIRAYASMMMLATISLVIPSTFRRFLTSQDLTALHGPRATALDSTIAITLLLTYGLYLLYALRTHPELFLTGESLPEGDPDRERGSWRAVATLLVASLGAAWMSEILVGAVDETGRALGMTRVFMGLVPLALIGGAAESSSAIVMARANKMDLSLGIALGSSIQIVLFIAPLLVLAGPPVAGHPLTLAFTRAEVGALFLAVLIGVLVGGDGRSNWFKGVQLIGIYLLMAALFYSLPVSG